MTAIAIICWAGICSFLFVAFGLAMYALGWSRGYDDASKPWPECEYGYVRGEGIVARSVKSSANPE